MLFAMHGHVYFWYLVENIWMFLCFCGKYWSGFDPCKNNNIVIRRVMITVMGRPGCRCANQELLQIIIMPS